MNLKNLPPTFTKRYTLQERVGAGGMGELYLARDKTLNKPVAVKFILGDEDELSRRRFFREAKIQMRLEHEGIADLIDFAKEPVPYIVFEYVQGVTLWQYASQRGALPTDEAVDKMTQICTSMAYAHRHGILHRDLKTENVMLNDDGRTKIIDFGLARCSDITSTITKTGVILGTPAYMAPELVKGEKASKQADVYAAGVIFYELMTGQQPFVADTPVAVMMKCLKKEVPDPRQLNPDIDDGLTQIVLRALAKEAIDRYLSFDEMVNDLERWRKGEKMGGRATVEVKVPQLKSAGLTTTKNNKIPQQAEEIREEEKKSSFTKIALLLAIFVALAWYVTKISAEPSWHKAVALEVTASSCTVNWHTEVPQQFSCTVLNSDTRKRVTRQSEEKASKEHRFHISGLESSQKYVLQLAHDGDSLSRSFLTSSVELVKGVFACATKKNLFIDFEANVSSGLHIDVEGSDGTILADKKCKRAPPYIIKLPANVSHGQCTWTLSYGKKRLAKGLVSTSIPCYKAPYVEFALRHKLAKKRDHLWARALLWIGERLFAIDLAGAIVCYRLVRNKGTVASEQRTLQLEWLQHHGNRFPGALTELPNGRVFCVFGNGDIRVLAIEKRSSLWAQRRGFAGDYQLPPWLFDDKDQWFQPIDESEIFLALTDDQRGTVEARKGIHINGKVYYLVVQNNLFGLRSFDLKNERCHRLANISEKLLNKGRYFSGRLHLEKGNINWWPTGSLHHCNGRIFLLMRSRKRKDNIAAPYEYALVSWSIDSGKASLDCRFLNLCHIIDMNVDEAKGLVWCLGSEGVHRISVKDGQVMAKESFPVKGQALTIAGGLFSLEDNVYFAAHRTPQELQLGTSLAPGAFDGQFELFQLNWGKQSITSLQPPITVEKVVATDGAFRTFAFIDSSFVGFSAYHINSFSLAGRTLKKRRSFHFATLVREHVLCGWAINRDGVIATVVPEGHIYVLPHQLVLYN